MKVRFRVRRYIFNKFGLGSVRSQKSGFVTSFDSTENAWERATLGSTTCFSTHVYWNSYSQRYLAEPSPRVCDRRLLFSRQISPTRFLRAKSAAPGGSSTVHCDNGLKLQASAKSQDVRVRENTRISRWTET